MMNKLKPAAPFLFLLMMVVLSLTNIAAQTVPGTPADKAVLYFVRVDPTPLLDSAALFADQQVLRPYLFGKQYARHELDPGSYTFWASGGAAPFHPNRGWIHGELEAGKTYGIIVRLRNTGFARGWALLPLDESFKNYDKAMEIVSGKLPKELNEKKQAKAEKQYQAMLQRAEKRKGKGKRSYWELKINYIA
jgi:hypothetical protein